MANEQEPRSPEAEEPIIVPSQALVPDPLVESLVPDPSQPPTTTVSLTGLLGRSAKKVTGACTLAALLSATRSSKKRTCSTA